MKKNEKKHQKKQFRLLEQVKKHNAIIRYDQIYGKPRVDFSFAVGYAIDVGIAERRKPPPT
jgi:hypothetical protein